MFHRFAHLDTLKTKQGQTVKKGQLIATMGKTGTASVHLHWDICNYNPGLTYIEGWAKKAVEENYIEPKVVDGLPSENDHTGYGWLEWNGSGYHPGIDINGPGAGNADLGQAIYAPIDGKVIYSYDGGGKNSGWGNILIIEETPMTSNWEKAVSTTAKNLDFNYGDSLNENEADEYIERVNKLLEKNEALDSANYDLAMEISDKQTELVENEKEIKKLKDTVAIQREQIELLEETKLGTVILDLGNFLIIKK